MNDNKSIQFPWQKAVGGVLGIVLGAVVYRLRPDGMPPEGMRVLGLFLSAIFFWVFNVLPFYVTALTLAVSFAFLRVVPFELAFSGYLSTTWWFMMGALGISAALSKSGLMRRFTYSIMKLFSPTYKGQVLGMTVASLVVTPLIPSVTAKTSMIMPIAKTVSDLMGYKPKSREIHGLFLSAFCGITLISHAFISSNFNCYVASAALPEEDRLAFGWGKWLLASFPQVLIVMVILVVTILIRYRPREESSRMTKDDIQRELDAMGILTRREKFTIAVLLVAVVLWATENLHGIPGYQIALIGLLIYLATGTIGVEEVRNGIPWDTLLMVGALLGLGNVFDQVGVNEFLAAAITPMLSSLSGNAYLFIAFIALSTYAIRLIYSNVMAMLAIYIPLLIPIAQAAGIHSWVAAYACMASAATWTVIFQNNFVVQGYGVFGGEEGLHFSWLSRMSVFYMVVNIVALWISVPYWRLMGLIA